MQIEKFKKLEKKINNQNFNQSYRNINIIMFLLSIFGHLTSIFLAYFTLSKVLSGIIDNGVVVAISSIVMLSGLELLKRDIFDKFSAQYLKLQSFTKDIAPLLIASFLIVSTSFYLSINGAREFASKESIIEEAKVVTIDTYKDSITNIYNLKIEDIENEIKSEKNKIEIKDKEQTELESIQPPTWTQRNRIKDLKSEKMVIREDIAKLEEDINLLKQELDNKIKKHVDEVTVSAEGEKKETNENALIFVLISTIIELIILVGVYFNEYYKFRSYREFRNIIERDPNYQKWILYEQILNVIFTEDTKVNQKLPSNKNIIEMCKVNDIIVMPKDITGFLKTLDNIGIIKTSGSAKYFNKQKDISLENLKKHFNIE